jgi:photosystem II stability/assembly factor-like uncharacterized protein
MEKLLFIFGMLIIGLMSNLLEAQTQWSPQTNPLVNGTLLGKLQFVSPTEGWISADKGDLLHTTNAGATWNRVVPFPNDTVFSMSDPSITMSWVNQTHGWKINWFGSSLNDAHGAVIHKTTDGGVTWGKKVLSTSVGDMGMQVQFVDNNNGWASIYNSRNGTFSTMRSTDGGNNWSPIASGGMFYFVDVNNGWAVGMTVSGIPAIEHTINGGIDWSVQYTDTAGKFGRIQFTDLNNGWVVGDNSNILKTTNGGSNWTQITNTGISSGSKSKCVYFLNANTGWIGTNVPNPQGDQRFILYTNNGGSSWTMQNPQISGPVFSIFFWDANNGWFTGDQCVQNCNGPDSLRVEAGVIGHTTNGGATEVEKSNNSIPSRYVLSQNYPNPFNPSTSISFKLSTSSFVSLKIFDLLGREVSTIVSEQLLAGSHVREWNANGMPGGVYFYRLQAGSTTETKKLVLLK